MLGFGNSNITRLLASDISEDMVSLTVRNLALLTRQGLDARERELKEYFGQYQKPSHRKPLTAWPGFVTAFATMWSPWPLRQTAPG